MEVHRERPANSAVTVPTERPFIGTRDSEETTAPSGLPVEIELAARIAAYGESRASDLLGYQLPEERQERILHMLDMLAAASARLSAELCKEDHGTYMALWSQIDEVASRAEAHLIALERDVDASVAPDPGWLIEALAMFLVKYRKLYGHFEEARRKRELSLEAIRDYRKLVERQRQRASDIHENAVQHMKRLLLQDDEHYRQLNDVIAQVAHDLQDAQRKGYYGKIDEYKVNLQTLKEQLPRMEQEAYDKALQQLQESDNGPRQK